MGGSSAPASWTRQAGNVRFFGVHSLLREVSGRSVQDRASHDQEAHACDVAGDPGQTETTDARAGEGNRTMARRGIARKTRSWSRVGIPGSLISKISITSIYIMWIP